MNAKDYIREGLTRIWSCFPEVQFRYEFKIFTQTHVVEVNPLSFFKENREYLMMESEFEFEFEQNFPEDEILFISEGSLTEVKNAEFQVGAIKLNFKNESFDFISTFESLDKTIDNSFNFAIAA